MNTVYTLNNYPSQSMLRERPQRELDVVWNAFLSNISTRIALLHAAVSEALHWSPDFSDSSLDILDRWLRKSTESTLAEASRLGIPDVEKDIMVGTWNSAAYKPSDRTVSYAMDVGIYLGELLIRRVPFARWYQPRKHKDYIDYGQPMLSGFGPSLASPRALAEKVVNQQLQERDPVSLLDICHIVLARAEDCPLDRLVQ